MTHSCVRCNRSSSQFSLPRRRILWVTCARETVYLACRSSLPAASPRNVRMHAAVKRPARPTRTTRARPCATSSLRCVRASAARAALAINAGSLVWFQTTRKQIPASHSSSLALPTHGGENEEKGNGEFAVPFRENHSLVFFFKGIV